MATMDLGVSSRAATKENRRKLAEDLFIQEDNIPISKLLLQQGSEFSMALDANFSKNKKVMTLLAEHVTGVNTLDKQIVGMRRLVSFVSETENRTDCDIEDLEATNILVNIITFWFFRQFSLIWSSN